MSSDFIIQLPLFDNPEPLLKQCIKCGKCYPLTDEFWYKAKGCKDGYRGECKKCHYDQIREWFKQNPQKNSEYQRKQYQKNPLKANERNRQWHKNNPTKVKAKWTRRRAGKKGAEGSYTVEELRIQHDSQNGCCYHCGKPIALNDGKNCHIDHWIPLSRGGTNWINNIRLLCQPCNNSKYNKLPCEWDSRYCDQ